MLEAIERFQRSAVWQPMPALRFHLRRFPIQRLRERLVLLERLQPHVGIHVSVSQRMHAAPAATTPVSTLIIDRSSVVLKQLPAGDSLITAILHRPSSLSVVSTTVRHLVERTLLQPGFTETPRQYIATIQAGRPATSAHAPLMLRLARRNERSEQLSDVPARSLRRPAPAVIPGFPGVSDTSSFRSPRRIDHAGSTASWPQRADAHAAVNVEQLADQVLRQLDRRLIASRERLGKI